jgi:hypothetical protein
MVAVVAVAVATMGPMLGCSGHRGSLDVVEAGYVPPGAVAPEDLLVVDCLLPGTVRKLGRGQVFMTPRRPIKTSASECEIRGSEYTAYDRADYRTALRVWLDSAERGDARAQSYVGEIYEKGLGVEPDYARAAEWYRKAAEQGFARAMTNLGQLYELGRGVERDPARAIAWYRKASGLQDAGLDFQAASLARATPGTGAVGAAQASETVVAALAPPSIQLIEPSIPETRALQIVYNPPAKAPQARRTLIGRVEAPAGLMALVVDDVEREVDADGLFRAELPIPESEREIVIAAVDRRGRRVERRLRIGVERSARDDAGPIGRTAARSGADFGRYHALVIGNGDYRHLPKLQTARADADAVAALLKDRYGFRVTLIRDATRYDILSTLNRLRATLTDEDNLLIYYAATASSTR